ncbi:nitroreductase family protein [Clostridium sartagoforme]|uniref:nitroreductase family protein n=1 Tax=Clostridium sartagoforme TaxID=84031 RepID=UPI001FAB2F14|nr:nitroreductase family protein [Clostridium sartagoforme]
MLVLNNVLNLSIKESIKARHSVRNYTDTPLSEDIIKKIENYIKNLSNPFNKEIKIKLIKKNSVNKDIKLGTYGVIKGANYFLVSACDNDDLSLIALGYSLEKVILYCTSLGLGTVWLGGTFNKGEFAKAINLKENEILPIVSPIGYEGGKKSVIATLFGSHTNKRKSYSELFFNGNFDTSLNPNDSDEYLEPLEMLRLAPSAMNKQPWRVLKEDNNLHFYITSTKGLTKIDIGIALCHFHLVAIENKINGEFKSLDSQKQKPNKDLTYIISWNK